MNAQFQLIRTAQHETAASRAQIAKNILDAELGLWLKMRKNLLYDYALDTIDEWCKIPVAECIGKYSAYSVLMPLHYQYISLWCRSKFVHDALKGKLNLDVLAMSSRAGLQSFMMEFPLIKKFPSYGGHFTLDVLGPLLAQVIVTGWQFQSEILARNALRELDSLLKQGGSRGSCGHFILALCCDWLQSQSTNPPVHINFTTEELGTRKKFFNIWKTRNLSDLENTICEMADFHLDQSRDAETEQDWFEFEDHGYWLFPVEVLSVLRLREWIGLPNPYLKHPLFSSTQIGFLQDIPRWPAHKVLDEAYLKFQCVFRELVDLGDLTYLKT